MKLRKLLCSATGGSSERKHHHRMHEHDRFTAGRTNEHTPPSTDENDFWSRPLVCACVTVFSMSSPAELNLNFTANRTTKIEIMCG